VLPSPRAKQLILCLDSPVATNVVQIDVALSQDAADEESAMAAERILLGAHEGDTIFLRPLLDPFDAFLEERGRGQTRVQDVALSVIVVVAFGTST
jgi:hypothetical protein